MLGLAKSGTAATKLLISNGIKVRVNDLKADDNTDAVTELKAMGAEVVVGSHPLFVLDDMELIVKNPGITYDNPIISEAQKRGIPIITEIELAGRLVDGSIIGITGSNGKTTTTSLIAQMLSKSDQKVKVAGNIGIVATEVAQTIEEDEKMILELSSFQLLGIQTFRPRVAVLLNIYEAHLDYHKTMANYQQAKYNIFTNQTADDFLVYNADDPAVVTAVKTAKSTLLPFSINKQLKDGAWADQDSIYFKAEKIIDKQEISLVGDHNLGNILAAINAAKLSGATTKGIHQVLKVFSGVKHRLQLVTQMNGRLFYNDSKATNMLATQKALLSFEQSTILLAGGMDRGNEFYDLIPFLGHVKAMVVFGQTAYKLENAAKEAGIHKVVVVENMDNAVQIAYSLSAPKDVILLSPACASWDQYRTFEERGDMFIDAVHRLA